MKNEESGRGEWGWLEGAPGQYWPPNLILTQSLHLKYTCGKCAVSNSSSLYTLFYSVIYNSVAAIQFYDVYRTVQYSTYSPLIQITSGSLSFSIPIVDCYRVYSLCFAYFVSKRLTQKYLFCNVLFNQGILASLW